LRVTLFVQQKSACSKKQQGMPRIRPCSTAARPHLSSWRTKRTSPIRRAAPREHDDRLWHQRLLAGHRGLCRGHRRTAPAVWNDCVLPRGQHRRAALGRGRGWSGGPNRTSTVRRVAKVRAWGQDPYELALPDPVLIRRDLWTLSDM